MDDIVEGDWKDFEFKMIRDEDIPRVLDCLRKYFYPYETLCSYRCSTDEEFDEMAADFSTCVVGAIQDGLSFFAEHKPTKQVAGVRITALTKKNENPENIQFNFSENPIIINFLTIASLQADVFSVYPDVDCYADFFMTATSFDFRGQGLVTEMYNRAMCLFKAKGIKLAKSVLTSPYTMKACKNLGFTEHCKLYLKDYKDEKGNSYFPNATTEYISVVSKRI